MSSVVGELDRCACRLWGWSQFHLGRPAWFVDVHLVCSGVRLRTFRLRWL